jgi:fructokinase
MIVCCGEALIDMVPGGDGPDSFVAKPGGCPLNTAIAAARLGARVEFLGRIGTDLFGEQLASALEADGVGLRLVARSGEPATLAFVRRDDRGNARYAFYSKGAADRSLSASDLPASLGADAAFLALGSISLLQEPAGGAIESLAERESGRGVAVSLDPNIRPSLVEDREAYMRRLERVIAIAAIVKASDDDLEWMFPGMGVEAAMDRLLGMGPALVAVTLGAKGAIALGRSGRARVGAFPVDVVDTIGAGDTFHAALLARLDSSGGARGRAALASLDSAALEGALEYAAAAAALDCSRPGADPPRAPELEAFLRARGGKA